MCSGCIAAISMIVAAVISTRGATALAVKTFGRRNEGGEASGESAKLGEKSLKGEAKENES